VTPDDYCADKAAPPGSDVYYSVLFLAPERRRATIALEAVRRELEDAVRDASDPAVVQSKLQWWRQELARLFEGGPEHPAAKALQPHLARYDIGAVHLGELLAGVEADAMQNRYLDWPNLRRHGDQVAGVAGRLTARIAGQTHARTLEFARLMALAEQLVHFVRNLGEDVRHNRVYIPVDGISGRACPRDLQGSTCRAAGRRSPRAAFSADSRRAGHAPARRGGSRRLPGAHAAYGPDAAAQALAGLEDADPRLIRL